MTVERIAATGKVGLIIWGNHAIRAGVTAMRDIFARIQADGGIHRIENTIAPVAEVFRAQKMDHVKDIETRFLR